MMFVISRIESYKYSECAAVFAESERTLARYDNPDWDPDKVKDNIHLVEPTFSGKIDDYILSLKKEFKCRMSVDPSLPRDKQTNVMSQAIFTASSDFFEGMSNAEIKSYFLGCLSYLLKEFKDIQVLSAVIHMDETTPHMHVTFLPLVHKVNSKGKEKTVFSTSDLYRGKDFFFGYQDRFYDYMQKLYPDKRLDRRGEEHQDHLTVKEYKQAKAEADRMIAVRDRLFQQCDAAQDELEGLQEMVAEVKEKPSIQMQIENAELKKQLSYYRKVCDYLLKKFPQLEQVFDWFRKSQREFER